MFKEKTFDILKSHFMYIFIGFGIGITVILLQTLIKSAHIAYQIDFEYYGFVYIAYLSFVLKKKKAISKPKIT